MSWLVRSGLVAALLVCSACPEQPNSLEGSIDESFDLSFDRTELKLVAGYLRLEYLQDIEGSDQPAVICRVIVPPPEGGVVAGEAIDIVPPDGVIERRAGGGEDFPDIDTASITFEEGGNEAGPASGRFISTFTTGKTLNGNFDTELEVVAF